MESPRPNERLALSSVRSNTNEVYYSALLLGLLYTPRTVDHDAREDVRCTAGERRRITNRTRHISRVLTNYWDDLQCSDPLCLTTEVDPILPA